MTNDSELDIALPEHLSKSLAEEIRPPVASEKSTRLAGLASQLEDIQEKVSKLAPDQLASIQQELQALRLEAQAIHNYQRGIYQWLVAIGEQVGIKPAGE